MAPRKKQNKPAPQTEVSSPTMEEIWADILKMRADLTSLISQLGAPIEYGTLNPAEASGIIPSQSRLLLLVQQPKTMGTPPKKSKPRPLIPISTVLTTSLSTLFQEIPVAIWTRNEPVNSTPRAMGVTPQHSPLWRTTKRSRLRLLRPNQRTSLHQRKKDAVTPEREHAYELAFHKSPTRLVKPRDAKNKHKFYPTSTSSPVGPKNSGGDKGKGTQRDESPLKSRAMCLPRLHSICTI